jgi:hypothetical protein
MDSDRIYPKLRIFKKSYYVDVAKPTKIVLYGESPDTEERLGKFDREISY